MIHFINETIQTFSLLLWKVFTFHTFDRQSGLLFIQMRFYFLFVYCIQWSHRVIIHSALIFIGVLIMIIIMKCGEWEKIYGHINNQNNGNAKTEEKKKKKLIITTTTTTKAFRSAMIKIHLTMWFIWLDHFIGRGLMSQSDKLAFSIKIAFCME